MHDNFKKRESIMWDESIIQHTTFSMKNNKYNHCTNPIQKLHVSTIPQKNVQLRRIYFLAFKNLDKLIKYVNGLQSSNESRINAFYSTPSCYLKSLNDAGITWPSKSDDLNEIGVVLGWSFCEEDKAYGSSLNILGVAC